jgi:hypothetical protein
MSTPKIQPAVANVMNIDLQPVAYCDPEKFTEGLDITVIPPGSLQPIAMIRLARGVLLMAVPPEAARHIVGQIRQAVAESSQPAGSVRPPGL